ncbi:MAG: Ig domain-containing protein [Lachnospiraceae bacterium]|nr:Ig domain-containing protein [Lachnospiraceae bacterium]
MRRKNCKRIKHIPALMLAAVLLVQQPFGSVGSVQAEKADTGEGLDYAGTGDATQISNPRIVDTISGSVSTWDCVWFGRYWQDTDSDGDGNVTDNDNKDPIKWRVLSFNSRTGDALLLSDRILDSFEYNTDNAFTTWENSTLRSFLNSYGTDHSETGFFNNAFSTKERNAITTTKVTVEKDIERNIDGGNPVNDKVFCLSSGEVRTQEFGFIKNEPTAAIPSATDKDATREAVVTDYVYNRYLRLTRGEGEVIYVKSNNGRHFWWCRSSTMSSGGSRQDYFASSVQDEGQSYMYGAQCTLGSGGVRPALWLNLSNNVGLWSNAGTVSSDGTKNETAPPDDDVSLPEKPVISDSSLTTKFTTWDCVYFGNYWQEDTNGDGHCYSKDTEKDGITYRADARQKIKWRVLDIDSGGKALLLSDKCLDTMDYIRTQGLADVTWSNSRMRSFLNSYDESVNRDSKDFSFDGFLNNAFNAAEIKAITNSEVLNPDNDVFGTSGGDATVDKVFCLSLEEARTAGYGFINNVYTKKLNPTLEKNHRTEDDNTRRTVITKYVEDSDLFVNLNPDDPYNSWWLRTPGGDEVCASTTGSSGSVSALGTQMYDYSVCVRPALRIDLKTYSDVWESAGKVSSDPPEPDPTEDTKVTGVSLPKELSLWEGETKTLTPVIEPSDATDQTVTWESSDDTVASVDPNGKVTGLKAGNAVIKATTNDGGFTAECKVTVSIYISTIKKPSTRNGVTTWDCVYFGNYWQNTDSDIEDSHEDGRVDRNDVKDPIKWRVLDIDGEGNALLLSDTLLDILEYNGTDESITWEESTLRAFLNSDEGYLKDGFITNAFSAEEIDAIFVSTLENEDNPVWGADGGNETRDAVFCLSLSEAMTAKYGFIKNRFSAPGSSSKQYLTGADPSRSAVATSFIEDKEGYTGYIAGSNADWWLRSPGYIRSYASRVYGGGEVNASSLSVTNRRVCVRPAIRINLKEHESLWEYAGIVKSDPAEEDDPEEPEEPEDEIVLEADEEDRELEMIPGEVRRLTTSKTGRYFYGIRWEVTSDPLKCVTVKNGVVTARKTGTAVVKASYGPCEPIIYNITVDGNSPAVAVGEEGSKISSKKKVTLVCDKTKTINVSLPPLLAGKTVTPGVLKGGVCTVKEVGRNAKGNKVSFAITALDAGATYVIWNVTDRAGNITQAYTKVIVKKPVTSLVIDHTQPLKLNVGEGKRLVVNTTLGNTDYRSLTFKVSGKGVKVSRSGYVTATAPGAYATVTVKGGGFSKTLDVEVHSADNKYMTVGNPLKEIKAPAVSKGKSKKLTFLLASPKRKGDRPAVTWDIQGKHDGIKIDGNVVTVDPSVTPGSYIVTADGEGFNSAYSELIVK